MTINTILVPTTTAPSRRAMLAGGDYEVLISEHPDDIVAAQRLRFEVFRAEPGYSADIGDDSSGLDADHFDVHCEHLLVRHLPTGSLVGCARVLPPPRAITAGGWYSANEFDLAELSPIRGDTVEMGRAVVHPDHRSGSVTGMLWAALLAYLEDGDYRYLMGCVSVPLPSPEGRGRGLRGVRDVALEKHRAPWRVRPYREVVVDGVGLDAVEPPAKPMLPPLLRGYVRLGARVCGEPAFDPIFDVGDLLTVLDRTQGHERYLQRLQDSVTRLDASGGRPR